MDEEDVHEGVELCCDVDVLSGVRRHGGGSISRDMDAQRHRGERETQLCAGILWNQIAQPGPRRKFIVAAIRVVVVARKVLGLQNPHCRARVGRTQRTKDPRERLGARAWEPLVSTRKEQASRILFSARGSCVGPRARSPPRSGLALESCADWLRGGLDRVRPTRPRASVSSLADARARFSDRHGRSTDSSEG